MSASPRPCDARVRVSRVLVSAATLGLLGIGGALLILHCRPECANKRVAKRVGTAPRAIPLPATNPAQARARAWHRVQGHIAQADKETACALDRHLNEIRHFLTGRKQGSTAFAERLLSLKGKWELVKSQVRSGGDAEYGRFVNAAFSNCIFRGEELQSAVNAGVRGFLIECEGIEAKLLVRLRADLADDELPLTEVVPALVSDQVLRRRFAELTAAVRHDAKTNLAVVAGREVLVWEASMIASELTVKIGAAVATRLGISSTLLATGAGFSWETLGISLGVAIVLDAVVGEAIKLTGYDAQQRVAARVSDMVDNLATSIIEGDPEARATLARLKTMRSDDPDPEVRAECARAIPAIEAGIQIHGLRGELQKLATARAAVRREALRRLIYGGPHQ